MSLPLIGGLAVLLVIVFVINKSQKKKK